MKSKIRTQRRAGAVLAALAFAAALVLGAATPANASTVTIVSSPLTVDSTNSASWWTPIVQHNGATYVSFLDDNLNAVVAKRDANGTWTQQIVDTGITADPGHTQASLAVDGDGYIHVFYGMHYDPIMYQRSDQPESVTGGFTDRSYEISSMTTNSHTYPVLDTAPNGDVYLMIRAAGWIGQLYRWNDSSNSWSGVAELGKISGYNFYPNGMTIDGSGDVHLVFEWATDRPRPERHIGTYARYSPSTDTFYKADGSAYSLPITPSTSHPYQPFESGEDWQEHGTQGAKVALDSSGNPMVAYTYSTTGQVSGYEHRFALWTGSQWTRQTISTSLSYKPWIAHDGGLTRFYYPDSSQDVQLVTSTDGGATWDPEEQVTSGLNVRSVPGDTSGGTDYLYLNSPGSGDFNLGVIEPTSGGGGGGPLFEDDFESGSSAWSVGTGSWSVQTDGSSVYTQTSSGTSGYVLAGSTSWTDYSVAARVKSYELPTNSAAGVLGRYSSSGYYWLRLHSSNQRVELYRNDGGTLTLLDHSPVTVNVNQWYDLELDMAGSSITGYVDGVPEISVSDSAVPSGRVGARSYQQSFAVDDVVVTEN